MSTIAIIFVCFPCLSFGSVFALGLTGTLKSIFGRRAARAAARAALANRFRARIPEGEFERLFTQESQ